MKSKREVAHKMDNGEKISTASNNIWNDLVGLLRIIDRGDAALNVPRYNGVFSEVIILKNDFPNNLSVVDQYIVPALELLNRELDPKTELNWMSARNYSGSFFTHTVLHK